MEKSCVDCMNAWKDGSGYSDWTWMDTEIRCAVGLNPKFPSNVPYEGTPDGCEFAQSCTNYRPATDFVMEKDTAIPTVSPDGHAQGSDERIGHLLRVLSRG